MVKKNIAYFVSKGKVLNNPLVGGFQWILKTKQKQQQQPKQNKNKQINKQKVSSFFQLKTRHKINPFLMLVIIRYLENRIGMLEKKPYFFLFSRFDGLVFVLPW